MEADSGTKKLTGGMYYARDDPSACPRTIGTCSARHAVPRPLGTAAAYPLRPVVRRI